MGFRLFVGGVAMIAVTAGCAQSTAVSGPGDALPPSAQPTLLAETATLAPGAREVASPVSACSPAKLPTRVPGVLTVAAPPAPAPPWITTADPAAGQGLEASIVRRVATTLGYQGATWVPAGSPADLRVGRHTTNDPAVRNGTAEFSAGYFAVTDTAVARRGAPTPSANQRRVGYVRATSGELAAGTMTAKARVGFDSERAGLAALASGGLDLMIIPVTSAVSLNPAGTVVAVEQLTPDGQRQPDQLVFLLPANSPLTPCINGAIDRLRVEGALADEARRWIGIPVEGGAR